MRNVQNVQAIKDECKKQKLLLPTQVAYVLATVQHETGDTFEPVREAFWVKNAEAWREANLRYYPYYGRGFVQLTWKTNYQKYSDILKVDLVSNPDAALDPVTAAFILVHGFIHGVFTGNKISDYINATRTDYRAARRCINGVDRADLIAGYARAWQSQLASVPPVP